MNRRSITLLVLMLPTLLMNVTSGASHQQWDGMPTFISGTSRYESGEWIYTDFVYDDYGADTIASGQPNVVSLAPTAGDYRYPSGAHYANNAADIVEVRARIGDASEDLDLRVTLQTIVDPTVVALRVLADGNETIVTHLNSQIDEGNNTVTFTLPDGASGSSVALSVGAGLHDGIGGLRAGTPGSARVSPSQITTGGPSDNRLFDAAFNTHGLEGRGGAWNEDVQSRLLAQGNLLPLTQTIDITMLRSGSVTTAFPITSGYHVRIFQSRQNLGEGMGASFPQYLGRWQPYAIWVPSGYSPATEVPLFLNMHSLSVHHNQYRGGSSPSASYKSLYEQYEAEIGAVVVTPLGRGPDGWYEDEALVDTMEVWADALKNYSIDRDRIHIGGYSMGGYGTYRLSTLMPDSFASAVSVVGPPANGIWAWPAAPTGGENNPDNTRPQLENTLHVPFWITHGVQDELVPISGVVHHARRFDELGHDYRLAIHPVADHFAFAFQDNWSREASWLADNPTRIENPHRVTFKHRQASWVTPGKSNGSTLLENLIALSTEVGARLDGAYWVDEVKASGTGDVTAFVDLSSGGIATRQNGLHEMADVKTDGPSPHALTGQNKVWTHGAATEDTLTGSLSAVESLVIDVGRAGLSDRPTVSIETDTPVTITFVRNGETIGDPLHLIPLT